VSKEGVECDPDKIVDARDWSEPKSKTELKSSKFEQPTVGSKNSFILIPSVPFDLPITSLHINNMEPTRTR
jgi:hypothetical protein